MPTDSDPARFCQMLELSVAARRRDHPPAVRLQPTDHLPHLHVRNVSARIAQSTPTDAPSGTTSRTFGSTTITLVPFTYRAAVTLPRPSRNRTPPRSVSRSALRRRVSALFFICGRQANNDREASHSSRRSRSAAPAPVGTRRAARWTGGCPPHRSRGTAGLSSSLSATRPSRSVAARVSVSPSYSTLMGCLSWPLCSHYAG
jgi:hypothetical protein